MVRLDHSDGFSRVPGEVYVCVNHIITQEFYNVFLGIQLRTVGPDNRPRQGKVVDKDLSRRSPILREWSPQVALGEPGA